MSWVDVDGAGWRWVHGLVIPEKVITLSKLKMIMVQLVFSFVIVLIQDEFDTNRTTFYPISISGRSFLFLMKAKSLSDTCFGSIQNLSDPLKKKPKTCQKC